MRILLKASLKAVRIGTFVVGINDGDMVFDTKNHTLKINKLIQIARVNGITLGDNIKSIQKVIHLLVSGFKSQHLPEQNEMQDNDTVLDIVKQGIQDSLTDDEMLVQIMQSGVAFRHTGRLFAAALETGGFRITTKSRKEKSAVFMNNADFKPVDYAGISSMASLLVQEISDTNFDQAIKVIKAYCKEFSINHFKAPKIPKVGFKVLVKLYMLNNPLATKAEFFAYIHDLKKNETTALRLWTVFSVCQAVAITTLKTLNHEVPNPYIMPADKPYVEQEEASIDDMLESRNNPTVQRTAA